MATITDLPTDRPFLMADEGYPVSGDAIRAHVYDSHPTQPFRMPDLLWPAVTWTAPTMGEQLLAASEQCSSLAEFYTNHAQQFEPGSLGYAGNLAEAAKYAGMAAQNKVLSDRYLRG